MARRLCLGSLCLLLAACGGTPTATTAPPPPTPTFDARPTQTIAALQAQVSSLQATIGAPTATSAATATPPPPTVSPTLARTPTPTRVVPTATATAPIPDIPATATRVAEQLATRTATTPAATAPAPSFRPTDRIGAPVPVNLRSGPGTSYAPLGTLAPGTQLEATGESVSAGGFLWRRFRLADGRLGWVRQADVLPVP